MCKGPGVGIRLEGKKGQCDGSIWVRDKVEGDELLEVLKNFKQEGDLI